MKQRCFNPHCTGYANWGGRGITICDEWLSFEGFYADMLDPLDGLSIDRIDNDGNYAPGNAFHGLEYSWFVEALRKHESATTAPASRLRLMIIPQSDKA